MRRYRQTVSTTTTTTTEDSPEDLREVRSPGEGGRMEELSPSVCLLLCSMLFLADIPLFFLLLLLLLCVTLLKPLACCVSLSVGSYLLSHHNS